MLTNIWRTKRYHFFCVNQKSVTHVDRVIITLDHNIYRNFTQHSMKYDYPIENCNEYFENYYLNYEQNRLDLSRRRCQQCVQQQNSEQKNQLQQ